MQAAFRSWMAVLELDKSLRGQLLGRVLIATMAESSLMVADCENPDEVPQIIDATIEWIDRLTEYADALRARWAVMFISMVPLHGPLAISVCMTPASVPSAWGV